MARHLAVNDDEEELEAQELKELGPSSMDMKIVRNHHHYDQTNFFHQPSSSGCASRAQTTMSPRSLQRTLLELRFPLNIHSV